MADIAFTEDDFKETPEFSEADFAQSPAEFSESDFAEPKAVAPLPPITLSPYEKARLSGEMPAQMGPLGPAHPEEVLTVPASLMQPPVPLPDWRATGRYLGPISAAYRGLVKPTVETAISPVGLLTAPVLAESAVARTLAGAGFAGITAKTALDKMNSPDPQEQQEGRAMLASVPLLAAGPGLIRKKLELPESLKGTAEPKEVITAATFTDPETKETTTGPNHVEAAAKQGVDATGRRESRETPEFGFQVQGGNLFERMAAARKQIEAEGFSIVDKGGKIVIAPKLTALTPEALKKSQPIPEDKVPQSVRAALNTYRDLWEKASKNPSLFASVDIPSEVVSRDEAEVVARESGQLLKAPETGQLHSDEVRSPVDSSKPLGDVPQGKGIAASARTKWATATDPNSEAGFINLDPLKELIDKATPYVKSAVRLARGIVSEEANISKLGDYGKAVLAWSAKQQKSFGEAFSAQKEIQDKVPDKVRREGITNWIQADGDPAVLASRLAATTDPKLKKGYEAALKLTPEEVAVANDVRNTYKALGARGLTYDILKTFKDNYVTQVWDLKKGLAFAGGRTLRDKFRFSKASTFDTFFDGEQAGYTPKTKDIAKILPSYIHEMNSVISSRQLVQDLSKGVSLDGRPLVTPKGSGTQVSGPSGSATLVTPKTIKGDFSDYRTLPDQPALNDWKWASTDQAGNPVFLKSDLALHPEAYSRLKNVLGRSAIREWYMSPGSALSTIPKLLVRGLDAANSETKRTMLGLLSPFHQVQEGTHAIGHRVNPFWKIPKVDLVVNTSQMDAAKHGVMLAPDRASANQFMEGFRQSGLVSKIPGIGPLADHYSHYLFHEYIPGLKFKTYEAILGRNRKVYADDLAAGRVAESDVKHLSAEQANAAYGHINYADLARNPTIQHLMQLGLLAPDFLEARARFTGQAIKGVTGAKVGREQVIALATLALAQAATAYTSAKISGGEWDAKRPFEFHLGNRRYTMRSVPEDVSSVLNDSRRFAYSRISPLIMKGLVQYGTRTDWRGQPITAGETTKELLQQPIPIGLRGFLGLGRQSLSGMEQLASAVGLRISRYSAANDVFDMAKKWMESSPDPKIKTRLALQQHSVFPVSDYLPLRNALNDDNTAEAKKAYTELLKTKTPSQVRTALAHPHPFTGKASDELKFIKSLTPDQKRIYDQAVNERKEIYRRFLKLTQ